MPKLSSLIDSLQQQSVSEEDVVHQIVTDVSLGRLDADAAITEINAYHREGKLSAALSQKILTGLSSASAATVIAQPAAGDNDKTQVVSSFDNDKTRVLSTGAPMSTVAEDDHTVVQGARANAGVSSPDAATFVANHTLDELTQQELTQQRSEMHVPRFTGTPKTGSIIKDRFILKEKLGAGGMSVVYRALDLRKQEAKNANPYVAIKVLGEDFKHHPQSLIVLERESQKIQNLAHPNIVTVYDFDRDGDTIYMTMECLQGESLDTVIRKHSVGMPVDDAMPVISGMCQALLYAHSKDIIHSDFKPENVFFTKENVVKVLDFGIARAKQQTDDKEKKNTVFDVGSLGALTPPYASLEMIEQKEPDPRDDIYALGCVTYKLLTGSHPFKNLQANQARDLNLKPERIANLTRRQWQTLEKSLAFERENRLESVEAFLDGFLPQTRSKWFYASVAIVLLATGVSGYAWFTAAQKPDIPKVILTAEQEAQIANYLEIADLYMSLNYLATPPGDSAYDQYEKILTIDPTNQAAIEGKKQITEKYIKLAEMKLELGDFIESMSLAKTGLIVDPGNQDLLDLQAKIEERQK